MVASVSCGAYHFFSVVKDLPANAGDPGDEGLIPGLGRSPGGGNGNPLQCSCWANPTDRGAWQSTIHGVTRSWTCLSMHALCHVTIINGI